ncbi:hypothetical protein FALCPG4_012025 [Fusarium falciforme]
MEGAVQVQQGATFILLQCTYAQTLSLPEREPTRSDGNFPFLMRRVLLLNQIFSFSFFPFFSTLCSPFLILLIPQSPPAWLFSFSPFSLRRSFYFLSFLPSLYSSTFTCPPPSPALSCRVLPQRQTELPRESATSTRHSAPLFCN